MPTSLDEHHAATLSEEELSAIQGDDQNEEDQDDSLQLDSVDDEEDADESDDGGAEGGEDSNDESAKDADDDAGPDDPLPTESGRQSDVRYQAAMLPADFQEQIAANNEAQRDLLQRFQEGEIEAGEYVAELSKITEQRDAMMAAKIKAEISQEMAEQAGAHEWRNAVNRFMDRAAKDENVDYRTDVVRAKDLALFVKALANDPENANQNGDWFLEEAHKLVNARRGTVPAEKQPAKTRTERPAPRKPDLKAVPNTLAHVPGSDGPGDITDEFGHLDALNGLDIENAIARMTPAQREKYARAG